MDYGICSGVPNFDKQIGLGREVDIFEGTELT
jgi:hypothetical protein